MKQIRTIAIFTLVEHKNKDGKFYGYGPYVKEINIWTRYFDKVIIVAPKSDDNVIEAIDLAYLHHNIEFKSIPHFNIKSITNLFKLGIKLPAIALKMISAMRKSNHLHFRSPSNVAAIASVLQIFFPSKKKTVKYAGNWDPKSRQPFGYRFQKWLFSNTSLSKNMKVLVYGEWQKQSHNVLPFFTASFNEVDKIDFLNKDYSSALKFIYLGALVEGKQPLLVIQIVEQLLKNHLEVELHMYGYGKLYQPLQDYITSKKLTSAIFLHGNKPFNDIKEEIKKAHFTILPSKSEGWPKALAEGMFFGVIPVATAVSCIPWMLDNGKRGILIASELNSAVAKIEEELKRGNSHLNSVAFKAQNWAQQFTLDSFEEGVRQVLEV
ncbi:glycosyltransferase [Winogradskyella sp.]|uniref:glycosyltransferase n=1 Tax=Winogradskyella sp. TaxID=1883156 RepID=UPI0026097787|nr:glycosyltransferase [Winogradskyella sp.]